MWLNLFFYSEPSDEGAHGEYFSQKLFMEKDLLPT